MLNSSGNSAFLRTEGVQVLRVRVFYHDKCFDGACSASLFTRFHRECIASGASYEYHGLVHRAGALFDESEFTGDENAIVDFKYSRLAAHHLVVRPSPLGLSHAPGPGEFPGLPAGPCLRQPQVLRPRLHLLHQLSGAHRLHALRLQHRAGRRADSLGQHRGRRKVREPRVGRRDGRSGHEADSHHRVHPGPDHFIPRLIPLLTEMPLAEVLGQPFVADSAAAAAGAPPTGHRADPRRAPRSATAPSSSTLPTSRWRATTSSSPTICTRRRPIPSACPSPASAPRSRSAPIPGPRPTRRRW